MTAPRTNWKEREKELRRTHGLYGYQRTPQRIIDQIREEKEAEERAERAYQASLPIKQPRPTSARERKAKRNAAKASQKKNGKRK